MPAKALATVPPERIRTLTASHLGAGPWGRDASAVVVDLDRELPRNTVNFPSTVPAGGGTAGPSIAVALWNSDEAATRSLLGAAALLAADVGGHVFAFVNGWPTSSTQLAQWGADDVLALDGTLVEEDIAHELAAWAAEAAPWAILVESTAPGREIAARAAALLGVGLASNAMRLTIEDDRLVVWRTAYDGQAVAAITATTELQMATVLTDSLATPTQRDNIAIRTKRVLVEPRGRVRVVSRTPTTPRVES